MTLLPGVALSTVMALAACAPPPTATAVPPGWPTATAGTSGWPTATAGTSGWPTATGEEKITESIEVSGTFDGKLRRYSGIGDGGQSEDQDPVFKVADGGTVKDVIIGAPAGDGIHCSGSCTLRNVWWEDVGEDAATFRGTSSSSTMTVEGGGARHATDKVFQHNNQGKLIIRNFQAEDFGTLVRSCGNCSSQSQRTIVVENVTVTAPAETLVRVNANYDDTATLSGIRIIGDNGKKIAICERYKGNDSGKEPEKIGSGADGTTCRYSSSDITYR